MKRIFTLFGVLSAILALIIFNRITSKKNLPDIYTEVSEGFFEITVSEAGELIPEKSVDIRGPTLQTRRNRRRGRRSRIHASALKILDIVPEGTVVKEGDFIAQLDRTTYENTLKDVVENLKKLEENLHMKVLDTAIVLTNLRNAIRNQTFTVEEAEITLQKSKYEPPSTIRQAEITVDRERRKLNQQKRAYKLRARQQYEEINKINNDISVQTGTMNDLQTYLAGFTVIAPSDGMVIYKRNRDGTKRKAGSTINPFDMVIATLPDLSSMMSKTYISEIEVNKVRPGQSVIINIDAYPDQNFTGKVASIANIGEKLPNSETKVFEVHIRIDGSDPRLRPSMTTGNKIIIESYDNVTFIPIECVHTGSEGIPFVYTKYGSRQVIVLGESNDKEVIVNKGLKAGMSIYIDTPENPDEFKLEGDNFITDIPQSNQ